VGGLEVLLTGFQRVLCLGAHADDIEIGCGGTVLRLLGVDPELEVHWVVLSASGGRSREARDSAASFLASAGRADVRVADFRESYFPYVGGDVKAYMDRLGAEIEPDVVFTHWRRDAHQDHRLVGELTWNTFRHHLILEYEIPKWDGDMGRPNVFVPLDRCLCEHKIDHLLGAFPSQTGKDWFRSEVFWSLLRLRGMEARAESGYAEAFHCSKLVLC
jgi:LmbE family N-acetylglucosaminyl deacetylase